MTDHVLIPRATLQQVLDALTNDGCHEEGCPDSNDCFNDQCDYCAPIRDTRTAMAMKQVKAALAAPCDPQQEPVGFVGAGYITLGEGRISETQTDVYRVPVYLAPPAQPQQERVYLVATGEVYEGQETYTRHDVLPPLCEAETLYTAPPAQPAAQPQPLTDEFVYKVVRFKQPSLDDTCRDWRVIFEECKYWLQAAHNIRSKE